VDSTTIRPLAPGDAEELAALHVRNRAVLRPFEPHPDDAFFTAEGQRDRIAQRPDGFAILDGERIAGVIALENVVRGASRSATVSYWVDRERNGRGLATAAVGAIVSVARDQHGLHRLQAPVLTDNRASERVLEKNGFERIGIARGYLHVGGEWRDHVLFQRLLAR
jgi:[ribosomal protein S5]-alanine N-acetyltransferase